MRVVQVSISKDTLVVYHHSERWLREFVEMLRRYGVEPERMYASLCG